MVNGKSSAFVFLLLTAGSAFCAPPSLDLPAEVRAAGDYITVTPSTDAVSVIYIGLSGVDPFPSGMLKDARSFVLSVRGLPKGRYSFVAVGASNTGEQARADFVVLVGDAPTPPAPVPVPTPVNGVFTESLRSAYQSAPDPTGKAALTAYYNTASAMVNDPRYTSAGQLWQALAAKQAELKSTTALPAVRDVMRVEMRKVWPETILPTMELTAEQRRGASELFAKAAAVLGGIQ